MSAGEPPWAAQRLLAWAVGNPPAAEGILGDLTEEFRARREARGPAGALFWFWMQALWISVVFRVRGRSIRRGRSRRATLAGGLLDELVHVGRALRRAPGFTALSVAILALGIGASTAVFEGFRSVVLADLPVYEPDRVLTLSLFDGRGGSVSLVPEEITALDGEVGTLRAVAGVLAGTGTMPIAEDGRPLVLDFAFVTSSFFDVLGARPALGRLFRPEDAAEGAPPVTVISHRTWQREFGGARDVLGRHLEGNQYQGRYEIVGVAPSGLDHPLGVDYWILPGPRRQSLGVLARLAPGATPDAAQAEFLSWRQAIDGAREEPSGPVRVEAQRLVDAVIADARPLLTAVTAAAALLLLIACTNVAGLLFMRSARRGRDLTVRRALGASSARIARLLLLEGALLGAAGGTGGLVLASALLALFPHVAPNELPRAETIGAGGAPVGLAAAVSALAVILVTAFPALVAGRGSPAAELRTSGRWMSSSREARRTRRLMVGAQVALAVIVLFGAGLLARTLHRLSGLELGYEPERVSVLELGIDRRGLGGPTELADLLDGIFEDLRAVPGVRSVSPLMARPFADGVFRTRPLVEGTPEVQTEADPPIPLESGGPEIFQTLGIPVLQGRAFLESDREDAPNVAVVSESLAARWWPGQDPVGRRIRLSLGREEWWTVVGVAGETRFRQLREITPTIYLPWRQFQILPMAWTVALRTEGDPAALAPAVRAAIEASDPRVYLWTSGSLREHLGRGPLAAPRSTAAALLTFGAAALLLAAVGLYGVTGLAVEERTRELGIRRALGATERALRRDVLADALRTASIGCAVGLGFALFGARWLDPLLFQVEPGDPATAIGVAVVILAAALLAAHAPVRRAMRVDPRVALQGE